MEQPKSQEYDILLNIIMKIYSGTKLHNVLKHVVNLALNTSLMAEYSQWNQESKCSITK